MKKLWQQGDLEGGGVQSLNLLLTQSMRKKNIAYFLWLGFIFGLHRFYIFDARSGWAFIGLSLITVVIWLSLPNYWFILPLIIICCWAIVDLWWLDGKITRLNKEIRMQAYLKQGAHPPQHYKGRYTENNEELIQSYIQEKEQEKAGVQPINTQVKANRALPLSFAEQEKLLREQIKAKKQQKDK